MSLGSKITKSRKKHHNESEEEPSSRGYAAGTKDFEFENDEEHIEDEEQDDIEHSKGDIVLPHLMMDHLDSLCNYLSSKKQLTVSFGRIKSKVDDWVATRKNEIEDPIDQEVLLKSLKQYLALSLRQSNISVENGIRCMKDYLDRGEAVLHYPDFPKKPPSLLILYCKKNGLPLNFGKLKEAQELMREDHVGRQETEHELDLKEILGPQPRVVKAKQTNGKRPKKDVSAFDLFCSTKTDNARHLLKGRNSLPVVYGGQVIGQALSAATATVEVGFVPNSLHSYFVQSGNVHKPILYMVDRIRDGRSFCTRLVKAVQDGDAIFTVQISFHRPEPESIIHQLTMPEVTGPDGLQDWNQIIEEAMKNPNLPQAAAAILKFKKKEIPPAFFRIFCFRPVDVDSFLLSPLDVDAEQKPIQESFKSYMWIKANENIGGYIVLFLFLKWKYIFRMGFIPSMALTLDHSIWMHSDKFRVDEWMLYENHSTVAC
uniref:Acyl-coenzyme A thioesterase 8 n=1 Tax=Heterorhabditis bacteriophora TaxID=37862 RepID=A0A1I7XNR9_HETBA